MRHLSRAWALALTLAVAVAAVAWSVAQAGTGTGVGSTEPARSAGGGFAAAGAGFRARVVSITERDFRISAPASIRAGTVQFRIHNRGPDTHELLIARASNGWLPFRADGLTVEEEMIHPSVFEGQERGKTGELRVRLAPGRYVLFCNMAGHYLAGMRKTIVVR